MTVTQIPQNDRARPYIGGGLGIKRQSSVTYLFMFKYLPICGGSELCGACQSSVMLPEHESFFSIRRRYRQSNRSIQLSLTAHQRILLEQQKIGKNTRKSFLKSQVGSAVDSIVLALILPGHKYPPLTYAEVERLEHLQSVCD